MFQLLLLLLPVTPATAALYRSGLGALWPAAHILENIGVNTKPNQTRNKLFLVESWAGPAVLAVLAALDVITGCAGYTGCTGCTSVHAVLTVLVLAVHAVITG